MKHQKKALITAEFDPAGVAHLAGAADDVKVHHSAMIVEDLQTLQAGGVPVRLVNSEVLAEWQQKPTL